MGLFDWFKALSGGDEKSAASASASLTGAIKEEAAIKGLDFVAAIEAHRQVERQAGRICGWHVRRKIGSRCHLS